jgi:hypothetical protein
MVQKMRASRVINFSGVEEMGANFKAFLPKRKGGKKKQQQEGTTNTSLDSELEQLEKKESSIRKGIICMYIMQKHITIFSSFLFILTLLLVADTQKTVHQIESETDFVT